MTEEVHEVALVVNGQPRTARVPARRLLSDCLRHDLGYTGTHVGCEHGVCGACTVLVDGEPMRSCLLFAVSRRRCGGHHRRGVPGTGRRARPGAAGVPGLPRPAVRVLHARLHHHDHRLPARPPRPRRRRGAGGDRRQPLPVHRLPEHRRLRAARRRVDRHNFGEVVASRPPGGHNFPEVVAGGRSGDHDFGDVVTIMGATRMFGEPIARREDPRLVSGDGRYLDDLGQEALAAAFVRSPHAHARVTDIDVTDALDVDGLVAIYTYEDLDGRVAEPLPLLIPHPALHAPRTGVSAGQRRWSTTSARRSSWWSPPTGTWPRTPPSGSGSLRAAAGGRRHRRRARRHARRPRRRARQRRRPHGPGGRRRPGRDRRRPAPAAPRPRHRAVGLDADGGQGRLRPLGRRRPVAAGVHVDPDVDVRPVRAGRQARPSRGPGRGRHARRRRRLRGEDRAPVAGGGPRPVGRDPSTAAGQVGRGPARALHLLGARAGPGAHVSRSASTTTAGCSAWTCEFGHDNGAYTPYGIIVADHHLDPAARPVQAGRLPGRVPLALHEHRASSRRTAAPAGRRACFAMERTMDAIAARAGTRPGRGPRAQLHPARRDALRPRADLPGRPAADLRLRRLPGAAATSSRHWSAGTTSPACESRRGQEGRRVGIGLACYVEGTGVGPYEGAHVRVETTGHVVVATGLTTQGQGHETVFAQIAADELGVPIENGQRDDRRHPAVQVRRRHVRLPRRRDERQRGRARRPQGARQGAADRRRRARGRRRRPGDRRRGGAGQGHPAGAAFHWRRSRCCPTRCGTRSTRRPRRATQFAVGGSSTSRRSPRTTSPAWRPPTTTRRCARRSPTACTPSIVETDPDTAEIKILRYCVVHDCGTLINPMIVEGQVHGGVAQGVGGALYERIVYDESGQLLNASYMDFLMPYASEVPNVETDHLETPSPLNPLGVKGAGEAGVIPGAAVHRGGDRGRRGHHDHPDADLAVRAVGTAREPMKISGAATLHAPVDGGVRRTQRPGGPGPHDPRLPTARAGRARRVHDGRHRRRGLDQGHLRRRGRADRPAGAARVRPARVRLGRARHRVRRGEGTSGVGRRRHHDAHLRRGRGRRRHDRRRRPADARRRGPQDGGRVLRGGGRGADVPCRRRRSWRGRGGSRIRPRQHIAGAPAGERTPELRAGSPSERSWGRGSPLPGSSSVHCWPAVRGVEEDGSVRCGGRTARAGARPAHRRLRQGQPRLLRPARRALCRRDRRRTGRPAGDGDHRLHPRRRAGGTLGPRQRGARSGHRADPGGRPAARCPHRARHVRAGPRTRHRLQHRRAGRPGRRHSGRVPQDAPRSAARTATAAAG